MHIDKLKEATHIQHRLEARLLVGFTVPSRGLFQFTEIPFDLHSASPTFQRLIDIVIGSDLDPFCFDDLDDIIVLGRTFEEHFSNA